MAKKRMFDLDVVDTDAFLEMSQGARLLYYDLGMRADDDGFLANPKKVMRISNASEDDFRILLARQFVIPFENGICVIRHWKLNNYLRGDRYKETLYKDQKRLLTEDENGVYSFKDNILVYQKDTNGIHSIEENSIVKNSIDNNNIYEFLEQNFGRTISPIEFEKINKWLETFTEDIVKYSIELCVTYNAKTFSYLNKILNNWKAKGYKLLQEIKDNDIKKNKKGELPSWFGKEITRDDDVPEEKRREIDELIAKYSSEETTT